MERELDNNNAAAPRVSVGGGQDIGAAHMVRGMRRAMRCIDAGMTGAEAREAIRQAAQDYESALPRHLREVANHA